MNEILVNGKITKKTISLYTEKYGCFDNISEMTAVEFAQRNLRYRFTCDNMYFYEDKDDGNFYYLTKSELDVFTYGTA